MPEHGAMGDVHGLRHEQTWITTSVRNRMPLPSARIESPIVWKFLISDARSLHLSGLANDCSLVLPSFGDSNSCPGVFAWA